MKPRVFFQNDAEIAAKWFHVIFTVYKIAQMQKYAETFGLKPLGRFESIWAISASKLLFLGQAGKHLGYLDQLSP